MIALLDTNIVIAVGTRGEPRPDLSGFADITVSSLTWSELTMGLHAIRDLDEYRQRHARLNGARRLFGEGIPYDDDCVEAYERVISRVAGRQGSVRAHAVDRMIAATAIAHDLTIVTRDRSGFVGLEGLVDVEVR